MNSSNFAVRSALLLVLIFALVFVAACSSGGDEVTTTTAAAPAAPAAPAAAAPAAAPKSSLPPGPKVLSAAAAPVAPAPVLQAAPKVAKITRVIMAITPPSDMHVTPGQLGPPTNIQNNPMYEYLVGMDPVTGAWVPELATEWSVESDGKSMNFKLQKGVQFHSGWGEMTAKDVKHTWADLASPTASHGNSVYMRTAVSDVEIVNDYEVIFRAPKPDAGMLWVIARQEQSILVQSKDNFDAVGIPTLGEKPIAGTGVYQFKERTDSTFVRFERPPYQHWRFTPDFQEFELRFIAEPSTRLAALLAGELHVAEIPEDLKQQALDRGFAIARGNAAGLRTFMGLRGLARMPADIKTRGQIPAYDAAYKYPDSPLQDIRVRRALNQAIDRDLINKHFFKGKGEVMIQNHFHPTRPGWDPSWVTRWEEAYGYNPAKAKDLLAEAGYSDSNPYEINMQMVNLSHYGGSLDVVEAVAGMWRDVGIKTKLITEDTATYRARSRNFEYSNRAVITGTSSHVLMGSRVYITAHTPRVGNYEIPAIDRYYAELKLTLDPAKQHELLQNIGEESFTNYQEIPLFWLPPEAIYNPEFVSGYSFPGSVTGTWTHLELIRAAQ